MLMDEPFGALDPVTRDALGRAYRALHDRLGLTTLMVTHDIAEALAARRPDRRADRRPHPRRRARPPPCSPATIPTCGRWSTCRAGRRKGWRRCEPGSRRGAGGAAGAGPRRICCSAAARSASACSSACRSRSCRRAAPRVRDAGARPRRAGPDHPGAGLARALLSGAADPRPGDGPRHPGARLPAGLDRAQPLRPAADRPERRRRAAGHRSRRDRGGRRARHDRGASG